MAQNATTNELAGGPVPAPGAIERTGSVDSALDRLWHLLTSMKLALLLILGFSALTLVGTLLMQMPAGVAEDPQARASWALLAASLVACTVQRIPGTWQTMRRPHITVGPSFFEHAPQHEAMTFHRAPVEVVAAVQGVFSHHHYR